MSREVILKVRDLDVEFDTYGGVVHAVRGVNFDVTKGKTMAIVGESGCGKSVTVQSILGLIPMPPGRVTRGSAILEGEEILGVSRAKLNSIRGRRIGMIFQDPMTSLNPTMTIGKQICETLKVHYGVSHSEGMKRAVDLLDQTKIPEAKKRSNQYPFEFSGGMLQRAMISMALACRPQILVADEPTTALDVTIQEQILELLKELEKQETMSLILITHDLGVVARMADDVSVMYAGLIVESGSVDDIYYRPSHPYTMGLRAAMPSNREGYKRRLEPIEGSPPDLFHPPKGCGYFARCPYAMNVCRDHPPRNYKSNGHESLCWLHEAGANKVDGEEFHYLDRL